MKNLSILIIVFLLLQFTTPAQQGWFQPPSGITVDLNSVYFVNADNGTAVGFRGTILRTINTTITFDTSLVTYYPFNGNADDESGNGNHGTVYGATLSTDRFGNTNNSYDFNGVDNYIKASSSGLPSTDRTISIWFNANTVVTQPVLLGYGGDNAGSGKSFFMVLNICTHPSTYHTQCHWEVNNISYPYSVDPIDYWIHWVVTSDSSGTKYYINNTLVLESLIKYTNTVVDGKDLSVGVCVSKYGYAPYTDGCVGYFSGKLDDIRIYKRALSENEIDSLYHEGGWPSSVKEIAGNKLPNEFRLRQNYPNPFNPTTTIIYQILEFSFVTIKVYDVLGSEIAILINEEKPSGSYEVEFESQGLTSGIYFYRLQAGNYIETKKMALLR